jgi:hypothetical protein
MSEANPVKRAVRASFAIGTFAIRTRGWMAREGLS